MGNEASSNSEDDERSDNLLHLTSMQIRQTRKLWKLAQHDTTGEPGRSILRSTLRKAPQAARIFNFTDDPSGERTGKVDLMTHAKRFNTEINYMVDHLDDCKTAADHFQALGSRHIAFEQSGFRTKLWDVFADCMIEKTVEWGAKHQRNTASHEAWGKIVLFIIDNMKTGYYQALKADRRKRGNGSGTNSLRSSRTASPEPTSETADSATNSLAPTSSFKRGQMATSASSSAISTFDTRQNADQDAVPHNNNLLSPVSHAKVTATTSQPTEGPLSSSLRRGRVTSSSYRNLSTLCPDKSSDKQPVKGQLGEALQRNDRRSASFRHEREEKVKLAPVPSLIVSRQPQH